jgi:hypothetical protein
LPTELESAEIADIGAELEEAAEIVDPGAREPGRFAFR